MSRPPYSVRALMLLYRLTADLMNYMPRSHRGQRARTLATGRGATPAEIQHNVARFESDAFPIPVMRGFGART